MLALGVLASSIIFRVACLGASKKLHQNLLVNVLRSSMEFTDTTPKGRILNRFGKEIEIMDSKIPENFHMVLRQGLECLAAIIIISIGMPSFAIVLAPAFIGFALTQVNIQERRFFLSAKCGYTCLFNPFTLGAAKRGLTILEIFSVQKHFFENI